VLRASGVGAAIDAALLPSSPALRRALPDAAARARLALTGGDDYELCFCVPPRMMPLARIGEVTSRRGLRVLGVDGSRMALSRAGFDHFA
jgi:thiamine-monophosphate kinase